MNRMVGADTTQVLNPEADEEVMLTEEISEPKKLTPNQLNDLFYSCLRGYGWESKS